MGFVNYVNGVPVSVEINQGQKHMLKNLNSSSKEYGIDEKRFDIATNDKSYMSATEPGKAYVSASQKEHILHMMGSGTGAETASSASVHFSGVTGKNNKRNAFLLGDKT